MRIDIVSAVPDLMKSPIETSIIGRAIKSGLITVFLHNLHDYTHDKYKTIDDHAYGGQPGMVLKPAPIFECFEKLTSERTYDDIIFMTPDGMTFQQSLANQLSLKQNLIILAGHYKGVDQRVRDTWITKEISIGDYVLTGGELPALVVTDAIIRLIPGAISDGESALNDSFQDNLLDGPVYTRPAVYKGLKVPDVLISGNHKNILQYQHEQSLAKTKERRPDLLKK